ncbi:MAG: hypothetical protein PUP90_04220 [Nostoc sp. S4]|nr:hypothetical protein [Nostoc sp. S4]
MSLNNQVLDRLIFEDLPFVEANLSYLLPTTDQLFSYAYEPPSGVLRSNGSYQSYAYYNNGLPLSMFGEELATQFKNHH